MTTRDVLQHSVCQYLQTARENPIGSPSVVRQPRGSPEELLQLYTEASRRGPGSRFEGEVAGDASRRWTFRMRRVRRCCWPELIIGARDLCQGGCALLRERRRRRTTELAAGRGVIARAAEGSRRRARRLPHEHRAQLRGRGVRETVPSRHFPERNFNQMVLRRSSKHPLVAHRGLRPRANSELARLAAD